MPRYNLQLTAILLFLLLFPAVVNAGGRSDYDGKFEKYGLVDISKLDKSIIIKLMYSTSANFAHKDLYGDFDKAYLTPEAAGSLVAAQRQLKRVNRYYSLVIYDAGRPQSVQWKMWDAVKNMPNRRRYVAHPFKGGPHNYGVAVDIGLAYKGLEMDMGTRFDTFSYLSHTDRNEQLCRQGKISKAALYHRQLLRKVMTENGFMDYKREWWHFERHRIAYARRYLRLLKF